MPSADTLTTAKSIKLAASHIVLETDKPSRQRITIPAHRSLRIAREVARLLGMGPNT